MFVMALQFNSCLALTVVLLCLMSTFDGCGCQSGTAAGEKVREWCKWKGEKASVPIKHMDNHWNICLLTCFELSRVKVNGWVLNEPSPSNNTNYTAGCFTVDTAGGDSYHRRAWATIPFQEKVTNTEFNLTLNLNYTSTELDNAWTWRWINVTVAINGEIITLSTEYNHDITKWDVSLDQYLSCKELEWVGSTCSSAAAAEECSSSVTMKFLRMSAFTNFTRQREMNCDIDELDQWIAWILSAAFTLVLIVSTTVNCVYKKWKARSAQQSNIRYGTFQ